MILGLILQDHIFILILGKSIFTSFHFIPPLKDQAMENSDPILDSLDLKLD